MPAAPSAPPPVAPSTPAPAPAPAPAQSAPPAAPVKPEPKDRGPAPDWLSDIEGLDPDRKPVKPAEKPDDDLARTSEVVPPKKPDDKPDDTKPPVKPDEPTVKPVKAAELRAAYDNLKKEKREVLEPKIQSLESKIKELEARQPDDTKPLVEKMTAIEKRNAELEQHMQFVDFKKSKEFQEKYEQPFNDQWWSTVATFNELAVKEKIPDGLDDLGEPKFKIETRPATQADLARLANMPLSQLYDAVDEMFGKASSDVLGHIREVKKLSSAMNKALEDAQTKSGQWSKERQLKQQQERQQYHKLWTDYNKEIGERFPQMFGPEEGDSEGNALLEKGFATADRMFAPPKDSPTQTPEERIQFHAVLRHKIANHDRMALKLKRVNAELAETKAALEAYEKSEPPAGKGGGSKPVSKSFDEEVNDEIRKMDRA